MASKRVTVYESKISGLFSVGGPVHGENAKIMRRITAAAIEEAPIRSGALKASHRNGGALKIGRYRTHGSVYASAKHASWVHDGTHGPIYGKKPSRIRATFGRKKKGIGRFKGGKPMMSLPAYGVHGHKTLSEVAGQRANPWMTRAARRVLSSYGVFVR